MSVRKRLRQWWARRRRFAKSPRACHRSSLRSFEFLEDRVLMAAPENLDEMFARKTRRATATWGATYLENPTTFQWQPETLTYRDVTTGHEVWKLTNTPLLTTYLHNDIGFSPWNADGSVMAFAAWDRFTQAYSLPAQQEWRVIAMAANTDGRCLRPTVEAAQRKPADYFHWSPQEPDVLYQRGESHLGSGSHEDTLYRNTYVGDGVFAREAILTLPAAAAYGTINKMISADGRRLIIEQNGRYFPISILPDGSAVLDDPDGYSMNRGFGPYGATPAGGGSTAYHDQYTAGLGDWYFALPSDAPGTWWRVKTLGSAADGGALYTDDLIPPWNEPSYDFGEVWPENHGGVPVGNRASPWVQSNPYNPDKTTYWSHFVPDRWGRHALFSNVADYTPNGYGPAVWDILDHHWVTPSFGGGAQHHDWHGFTDWTVSSGGPADAATGRGATLIYAQKYDDPNSQFVVNNAHTRYDGGTGYASLVRPAQSPDGTKVAWHSEFLNGKDAVDIYWSVVYFPFAPTDLQASDAAAGGVALSFLPPKYTERRWIDPATGQIDEVNGEVLYAREINRYHLWRSSSPDGGWSTVGTVAAEYDNDPVTNTLKPRANGDWVGPSNKITFADHPGDGVWYYAMTSEEHSGLESDELSEVIRVTVSGGQVIDSQVVQAKGQRDFWRTAPLAPANLTAVAQPTPGHYRLAWNEPVDMKVRYYNVYYSTAGDPAAVQQQRIASLPVGTTTYLDWLADPKSQGYYGITAVDRYGNESAIVWVGVPAANHVPDAINDSYAVDGNQVLSVVASGILGNDIDPDGDPLAASLVSRPSHGTLTLGADGSFTYTPAADYLGWDSFTYRANDGTVYSNPSTVSISVLGLAMPTTGRPDLLPERDSGTSRNDDITSIDNSTPGRALRFSVAGTVVGATLTLYADGTAIGSALAIGDVTVVETNGSHDLSDGAHSITARQALAAKSPSEDSATLAVTIDTTPPTVVIRQAAGQADPTSTLPISFAVTFSEAVSGFNAADVTLGGTAPGATIASISGSGAAYAFGVSGLTGTGTVFARLAAGAAQDAAGNSSLASTTTDNVVVYEHVVGRYDFGTPTSPVAIGWTQVTNKTTYSAARGYGWLSGKISSANRTAATATDRDVNYTRDGTFVVNVPNGTYIVRAYLGDLAYKRDKMQLSAEAVVSPSLDRVKTVQPPWEGYATVTDGQLTLRLRDLGGTNYYASIAALEVVSLFTGPRISIADVALAEGNAGTTSFDFLVSLCHAVDYDVDVGYVTAGGTATAGSDFLPQSGTVRIAAGQTNATISVPVVRDWTVEPDETFYVNLTDAGGTWIQDHQAAGTIRNDDAPPTLTVSVSASSVAETAGTGALTGTVRRNGPPDSPLVVSLASANTAELTVPASVTIEAGQASATFAISVLDDAVYDANQAVAITASAAAFASGSATVTVVDNEQPAFALSLDFGTSSSPVEAGYQRVTNATKYSASLRNGWQKGYVYSADRATGSALQRDLTYTRDGTFAVDLPNGRYQVVATLGDTKYVRDRMGVFLEGVQVDDVTTNKTLVTRTYTVNVWDGQLTLRLDDLGGSNAYVALAALRVLTAPVANVVALATGYPTAPPSLPPVGLAPAATHEDQAIAAVSLLGPIASPSWAGMGPDGDPTDGLFWAVAVPRRRVLWAADAAYAVWTSGSRSPAPAFVLASAADEVHRLLDETSSLLSRRREFSGYHPVHSLFYSQRD